MLPDLNSGILVKPLLLVRKDLDSPDGHTHSGTPASIAADSLCVFMKIVASLKTSMSADSEQSCSSASAFLDHFCTVLTLTGSALSFFVCEGCSRMAKWLDLAKFGLKAAV